MGVFGEGSWKESIPMDIDRVSVDFAHFWRGFNDCLGDYSIIEFCFLVCLNFKR